MAMATKDIFKVRMTGGDHHGYVHAYELAEDKLTLLGRQNIPRIIINKAIRKVVVGSSLKIIRISLLNKWCYGIIGTGFAALSIFGHKYKNDT